MLSYAVLGDRNEHMKAEMAKRPASKKWNRCSAYAYGKAMSGVLDAGMALSRLINGRRQKLYGYETIYHRTMT